MAGIAGAYQVRDGLEQVAALGAAVAHRGRSRARRWSRCDGWLDVHLEHHGDATGPQPRHRDGLVICWDGRLRNHRELADVLAHDGVGPGSDDETDVLLAAWRRWGPRALTRLRGAFAIAVLDQRSGCLTLARDPIGVRPLHYLVQSGGVLFASELKAIVAVAGDTLHIEPGALIASMLYHWVPDQRCAVDEVVKLQPGTWAEFRPDASVRLHRYWDPADVAAAAVSGPHARIGAAVADSVRTHLEPHERASVVDDGDLPSAALVGAVRSERPGIAVWTLALTPSDPPDSDVADAIAVRAEPRPLETLAAVVAGFDEPTGDPLAVRTWLLAQTAGAAGLTSLVAATGAEDLLGGGSRRMACLAQLRSTGGPTAASSEESVVFASSIRCEPASLATMMAPELKPYLDAVLADHVEIYADSQLDDPVNRMCLADSRLVLTGLRLATTDQAAAAAGVEALLPFADPAVFRAAFTVPGRAKLPGARAGSALDRLATAAARLRPSTPPALGEAAGLIGSWMTGPLLDLVHDVLPSGRLVETGLLRPRAVGELTSSLATGAYDRGGEAWHLLITELWLRMAGAAGVAV